jgi:multidrug efflux pump
MERFNLAEWALNHKQLIYFFALLIILMGVYSYQNLGRMEFPDFVIRQMVVSVAWPGASAREVEEQVTDKIEKKLQDTPGLDYLQSYSQPGQSVIYINLKADTSEKDIRPIWMEVRNMVNDIKDTLPGGVVGPYFNDRFDDVFGSIYALTGNDYSYEQKRVQAERIRRILLGVENVKKVDLIGVQPEKIYIEMDNNKLAQLGVDPNVFSYALKTQNAMTPSGMMATRTDNVYVRVTGTFENLESIRNLPVRINDSIIRLGDVAKVKRDYEDPPEPKMYFNGSPAIGIAVSMDKGGNILTLGKNLQSTLEQIKRDLPIGLSIHQVSDQPAVVKDSINEFVETLIIAVLIVLAVSFLSLGIRTGLVVALCIPLVILAVFIGMKFIGIDLQNISLGALIIALSLLVDDAIIAVEMMTVKLEQGWDRFKAACFAYTVTAFPMLTGTLITCAGFIPVGFSKGSASEMVGSIFQVVTLALLISWLASVTVTPLLGYSLIKVKPKADQRDVYDTLFYQKFQRFLSWCLNRRKLVLGLTLGIFIFSIFLMNFVKQEFFPSSSRPEVIVDMTLPEGASFQATEREAKRLEKFLKGAPEIKNYSLYVGEGAPRFVLTADPVLPSNNFAQFLIVTKGFKERTALSQKLEKLFDEKFTSVRGHVKVLQMGPPSSYPVELRVSGYDVNKVRSIAQRMRTIMAANPNLGNIILQWEQKSKVMRLEVDSEKARLLGIDRQSLAMALHSQLSGVAVGEFREKDKTINIVSRIDSQNRNNLARLRDLTISLGNGRSVPLDQIAKISYEAEDGLIWRRDLKPTLTVQAEARPGITGNDATNQVYDSLSKLRASLPAGYRIDIGGALEQSHMAMGYLAPTIPMMLVAILILLMFQLQSISKMVITVLTAPLGMIGAILALLLTGSAMGFVAILGMLALSGIIIRNSVILIDQIEKQLEAGDSGWDAIINAATHRFRPIMLTAAAAILGMIPLMTSKFWGPMATAIAGGLLVATILTLIVLPTMYAAWFKIKPDHN